VERLELKLGFLLGLGELLVSLDPGDDVLHGPRL